VETLKVYCDSKDNATYLYSGSSDGSIKKWDISLGVVIQSLTDHKTSVYSLEFIHDFMFSASADKTVLKWDLNVSCS
jgi:WD40 repeat protein